MPWDYAQQSGILKKWADKYGIKIKLTQINDYVESINQYTAGKFDGCVMTNMDMLTIPAAGGVDSTALIVGDYSNGNDGVVLKGAGKKLADIKGQSVNLVELSVSHYLLARGLESVGLAERDIKVVNTSDADIVSAFATPGVTATVTWKPQLAEVTAMPKTTLVFDSSKTPGEILDLMVVNSEVLKANPKLGKALVGAWYETLALMGAKDAKATAALESMAKASGTDLAGFKGQLATTYLYSTPASAVAAAKAPGPREEDGPGAQVLLRSRPARRGRQDRRCRGHRVPGRRHARQQGQSQDALRRELHADGGRRQALKPSHAPQCVA